MSVVPTINPLSYVGKEPVSRDYTFTRDPSGQDNSGYNPGDMWLNSLTGLSFRLMAKGPDGAVWRMTNTPEIFNLVSFQTIGNTMVQIPLSSEFEPDCTYFFKTVLVARRIDTPTNDNGLGTQVWCSGRRPGTGNVAMVGFTIPLTQTDIAPPPSIVCTAVGPGLFLDITGPAGENYQYDGYTVTTKNGYPVVET